EPLSAVSGESCRFAADEAEVRGDRAWRTARALLIDAFDQKGHGAGRDLLTAHIHAGHGRDRESRLVDVVESHDSDVFVHADAAIAERAQSTHPEGVAQGEYCIERRPLF